MLYLFPALILVIVELLLYFNNKIKSDLKIEELNDKLATITDEKDALEIKYNDILNNIKKKEELKRSKDLDEMQLLFTKVNILDDKLTFFNNSFKTKLDLIAALLEKNDAQVNSVLETPTVDEEEKNADEFEQFEEQKNTNIDSQPNNDSINENYQDVATENGESEEKYNGASFEAENNQNVEQTEQSFEENVEEDNKENVADNVINEQTSEDLAEQNENILDNENTYIDSQENNSGQDTNIQPQNIDESEFLDIDANEDDDNTNDTNDINNTDNTDNPDNGGDASKEENIELEENKEIESDNETIEDNDINYETSNNTDNEIINNDIETEYNNIGNNEIEENENSADYSEDVNNNSLEPVEQNNMDIPTGEENDEIIDEEDDETTNNEQLISNDLDNEPLLTDDTENEKLLTDSFEDEALIEDDNQSNLNIQGSETSSDNYNDNPINSEQNNNTVNEQEDFDLDSLQLPNSDTETFDLNINKTQDDLDNKDFDNYDKLSDSADNIGIDNDDIFSEIDENDDEDLNSNNTTAKEPANENNQLNSNPNTQREVVLDGQELEDKIIQEDTVDATKGNPMVEPTIDGEEKYSSKQVDEEDEEQPFDNTSSFDIDILNDGFGTEDDVKNNSSYNTNQNTDKNNNSDDSDELLQTQSDINSDNELSMALTELNGMNDDKDFDEKQTDQINIPTNNINDSKNQNVSMDTDDIDIDNISDIMNVVNDQHEEEKHNEDLKNNIEPLMDGTIGDKNTSQYQDEEDFLNSPIASQKNDVEDDGFDIKESLDKLRAQLSEDDETSN